MTAETPTTLAAALTDLQAHLPVIVKSETATVPTRAGGSYVYHYADLSTITREVLPLLSARGLAWVCAPTLTDAGRFVLRFQLLHVSGESLTGEYPLPAGGTAQEIGSAITYARRYALTSVIGLAPAADDDGAAASAQRPAARSPRRSTQDGHVSRETGSEQGDSAPKLMSQPQQRKLMALLKQAGHVERDQRLAYCSAAVGRELSTSSDLTLREAATIIDGLEQAIREPHDEPGGPA